MKYDPMKILIIMILVLLALPTLAVRAENPQALLNQYISELQKNPNDYALREKIIRHEQTMKPAPAIPREAERFMNRGATAAKSAKDANDFKHAVAEFEKATLSAPWMANAYYNLGVAQDKAGMHSNAIRNLKLYLLAAPNAPDTKSVEKLIDEIEYRQEKVAKESSPQTIVAKKQNEHEGLLKKIDGRRYRETRGGPVIIEVRGKYLVLTGPGVAGGPWEIKGHSASTPRVMQPPPLPVQTTFIISEDGGRITERREFSDGDTREFVWLWQR